MPSSVIADWNYDEAARALTITFLTGRIYRYIDVPPELIERMRRVTSKGGFFNRHVRDKFDFVRLH